MTTDGWEQRLADLGQAREESTDLTPGVVWTDAQLSIVRDLVARAAKAQAAVKRVEALLKAWEDDSRHWYYENRYTHPNGIEYVAGYEDGWNHADDLLRRALDGTP